MASCYRPKPHWPPVVLAPPTHFDFDWLALWPHWHVQGADEVAMVAKRDNVRDIQRPVTTGAPRGTKGSMYSTRPVRSAHLCSSSDDNAKHDEVAAEHDEGPTEHDGAGLQHALTACRSRRKKGRRRGNIPENAGKYSLSRIRSSVTLHVICDASPWCRGQHLPVIFSLEASSERSPP